MEPSAEVEEPPVELVPPVPPRDDHPPGPGLVDGVTDGDGVGVRDGVLVTLLDGVREGVREMLGVTDGVGVLDGVREGVTDGVGVPDAEGSAEGGTYGRPEEKEVMVICGILVVRIGLHSFPHQFPLENPTSVKL